MRPVRALVAEDHPLARQRLVSLLAREPDIELLNPCGDGRSAVAAIRRQRPDLVFLDLQLPELDGLGVVREVGAAAMPLVIFVTAYEEYAIRAFEIHAIDYLLKPFSSDSFRRALSHARVTLRRQRAEAFSERLFDLVREARPAAPPAASRLMVRSEGRVVFVRLDEVNWVEAEGNYARLYLEDGSHTIRETMKDIEARLGEPFVRIHRCHAVNLARIREVRAGGGELEVVLQDGTRLKVGQRFRARLEQRLLRA